MNVEVGGKAQVVHEELIRLLARELSRHSIPGYELVDEAPELEALRHLLQQPELMAKFAIMALGAQRAICELADIFEKSDEPPGSIAQQLVRTALI